MKQSKNFTCDISLSDRHGKIHGFARVTGIASYDMERNDSIIDPDYADFDVRNVRLKYGCGEQDSTFAYLIDKGIGGDLSEQIHKGLNAHLEYLFTDSNAIVEAEYTDLTQNERPYQVVCVAGTHQQLTEKAA